MDIFFEGSKIASLPRLNAAFPSAVPVFGFDLGYNVGVFGLEFVNPGNRRSKRVEINVE